MLCLSRVLPTMSPMIAPNICFMYLKLQSESLLLQLPIFRPAEAEEEGFFLFKLSHILLVLISQNKDIYLFLNRKRFCVIFTQGFHQAPLRVIINASLTLYFTIYPLSASLSCLPFLLRPPTPNVIPSTSKSDIFRVTFWMFLCI